MKKFTSLFPLLIIIILIFGCTDKYKNRSSQESTDNQYILKGEVVGFEDSTFLYLNGNNRVIDSVMIVDGKFEMRDTIEEPMNVFLMNKPATAFTNFWLEAGEILLKGSKDDFRNAEVIGSLANQQQVALNTLLAPVKKISDSLNSILLSNSYGRIQLQEEEKKQIVEEFMESRNELAELYQQFITEQPESYVSVYILNVFKTTWGKQITEDLFADVLASLKESSYGKDINEYLSLAQSLDVGDQYADFSMLSHKEEEIKLSDIKGKYVLLEFWASWCAPCREENPALVETYKQFKDQGFEILGVSLDIDKKSWLKAIEKDGLTWPNVSDLKGDQNEAGLMYGVSGIPDNFLIGPDGIIVDRKLRGDNLRNKLKEVFSADD